MYKFNENGFTVIELILSFTLVMFLAIAMFSLVNNYRIRQQKETIVKDLLALKTTLTQDIYEDMLNHKVEKIEYCKLEDDIIPQCINIYFLDGINKTLQIAKKDINVNEDGTEFTFETFDIIYGGVKYKNPDNKFVKIVNDYILIYSGDTPNEEEALEYGRLYKIQIILEHQDIDENIVIEVVATGVK